MLTIDFSSRTALVTGGTRGIGACIAEDLLNHNARVLATGTNRTQIDDLNKQANKASLNIKYLYVDFTDSESIEKFAAQVRKERIDVLINNAGINKIDCLAEIKLEDWERILTVNLTGAFRVMQAVTPQMKKNGYGRIVNMSSIWGEISKSKRASYSSSKFGLRGLTVAASNELSEFGVLINSVAPGFIMTELTKKILSPKEMQELAELIPMKRFGSTKEISNVVLFLASELNTYITGQNIVVDGGFTNV